jgi:hypothetical protein
LTGVKSMKDRYPAYDKITSVLTTVSEVPPTPPPPVVRCVLVGEKCSTVGFEP